MRSLFRIAVPAVLLLAAGIASAHGPVRQKVDEKIKIEASPDVVWEVIKNYGDLAWLPGVKSTEASNLPAADGDCEENTKNENVWVDDGGKVDAATTPCAIRTITLDDGNTIVEAIKKYSAGKMLYSYKITEMSTVKTIQHSGEEVPITTLPVSNYSAQIMVKDKKGSTEVIWKAGFYRGYMNNNPPPELTEEVAVAAVSELFKKGLENLKKIAEGK